MRYGPSPAQSELEVGGSNTSSSSDALDDMDTTPAGDTLYNTPNRTPPQTPHCSLLELTRDLDIAVRQVRANR